MRDLLTVALGALVPFLRGGASRHPPATTRIHTLSATHGEGDTVWRPSTNIGIVSFRIPAFTVPGCLLVASTLFGKVSLGQLGNS